MVLGEKTLGCVVILIGLLCCLPAGALTPSWEADVGKEYISDFAIAENGSSVIIGTATGKARVYDGNGTLLWETAVPGSLLVGCHGNGTGYVLASGEDLYSNKGAVRYYTGNGTERWFQNTGHVQDLALSSKNNRIVVGNRVSDLVVFNETGGEVAAFNELPRTYVVSDLSLSEDGKIVTYAVHERYPQIRYVTVDARKKTSFKRIAVGEKTGYGGEYPVLQMALSADGKYVASVWGEGIRTTLFLQASNGTVLWKKDLDDIRDIAIDPNGSVIYAATGTGKLLTYSRSGNITSDFTSCSGITSLSLAPGNGLCAAGNDQGDLFLFDKNNTLIATGHADGFPTGDITRVELSRDGTAIAVLANNRDLSYYPIAPEMINPPCPEQEVAESPATNGTLSVHSTGSTPPTSLYTPGLSPPAVTACPFRDVIGELVPPFLACFLLEEDSTTGNLTSAPAKMNGTVNATGNVTKTVTSAPVKTNGTVNATGNVTKTVTSAPVKTNGTVNATGNVTKTVTSAPVKVNGTVNVTGNVTRSAS